MAVGFEYGDKTIQELVHLFEHKQLNLELEFQRDDVRTSTDRKKIMETIIQNYPIPSIFLYRRYKDAYVGYPLGFTRGAIVGQGDTYSGALKDTESAIATFIEHYGIDKFYEHFDEQSDALETYIAVADISV